MTITTKLFSLSVLTLCVAACSGGGGSGGGAAATTSSTTSTSGENSATTTTFNIDGNAGVQYAMTYAPIATNDNSYLTPTVGSVQEANIYKVKPVSAENQAKLTEMINYTNNVRAAQGLTALQIDQTLMAAAQRRAEELVSYYSHTRPDGSALATMFNQNGGFGENISAGQTSVAVAMESFEKSKTHYDVMVNSSFTKTGVGFVYLPGSEYTFYWVQLFGVDGVDTKYSFDTTASAQQNKLADVTTKATNINDRTQWMTIDDFPIYLGKITPNGAWYSFSQTDGTTTYEGVLNGYNDVRFGLAQPSGSAHNVFYRGNNTQYDNMPTSGTASYTGKGVITDGSNSRYLNSAFHADFANKNLNGVLSENGTKVAEVNAMIRGVSFHSPSDATVETQGGFFGTNAKELGGVFYNHSTNEYGAFGATQ